MMKRLKKMLFYIRNREKCKVSYIYSIYYDTIVYGYDIAKRRKYKEHKKQFINNNTNNE